MTHDEKEQNEQADADRSRADSPAVQKGKLLKRAARRRQSRILRPDDIGVVRIEFSVPASRLFGPGSFTSGGGVAPDVLHDADSTDPIFFFDSDPTDEVLSVDAPEGGWPTSEPD